jgi:putative ABC transport system permease protein
MTATTLAASNLFRRPVRTLLSILGVGVGIGALVAFVSLAKGFREQFARMVDSTGAELVVQQRGAIAPEHSSITEEDLARMRATPGVAEVCASTFTVLLRGALPFVIQGRDAGSRILRMKYRILEGTTLTPGRDDELLVGKAMALLHNLPVGGTVTLGERTFRVVGRFEPVVPIPLENNSAITTLEAIRRLTPGDTRVHLAFLYLADPREAGAVRRAVEAALPGLEATPTSEFLDKFGGQLDMAEYFAWAISSLALAVAAIVVALVMLTNVNERTREIGTLRALGWSRGAVVGLILREGVLLCLLGALAGAALGVAGAEAFARGWRHGWFYVHFTPAIFAEAFGVAVGLGLVGAFYPAWRATGMTPVEALRYE